LGIDASALPVLIGRSGVDGAEGGIGEVSQALENLLGGQWRWFFYAPCRKLLAQ